MSRDVQAQIGLQALRHADPWMSMSKRARLEEEIAAGRSVVVVTGEGSVRRAVSIVALRLFNSVGSLLARIGKISDAGCEPDCELPGTKQETGETVGDSLERLVASKLKLANRIEWNDIRKSRSESANLNAHSIEAEVTEMKSRALGICTRYLRKTCSATLKEGEAIDAPSVSYRSAGDSVAPRFTFKFPDLLQRSVWAVPRAHDFDQGTWECYAWLSPEEFDFLTQSSDGAAMLTHWLSSLVLPSTIATPAASDAQSDVIRF
uniref:Uncharacterized protein n=1 Tax=Zooxanthella nutricula TaxID=1333877 RepID=A0A7S2NC80_9DINO